jgi:hypothetical protein
MKTTSRIGAAATVFVLIAAGCGRPEGVRLEIPAATPAAPKGIQVWIRDVVDNRKFEDDPSAFDIPSLPKVRRGTEQAVRARAVGRLRNMYGRPRGVLLLERGKTSVSNVRELISSALASLGYEIAADGTSVRPDAAILDVSLDQYWAWITPGAFSAAIECRIVATIAVPTQDGVRVEIKSDAKRKTGAAGRYAWQETFKAAHEEFVLTMNEWLDDKPLRRAAVAEDTDTLVNADTDSTSDTDLIIDTASDADSESNADSDSVPETSDPEPAPIITEDAAHPPR